MEMAIERLTECIGRAVRHARFRNVWGRYLDSSVMREFYAMKRKTEYCLSNTDAINVREPELTDLVNEIAPMVKRYCAAGTGAVGNGLYRMMGSIASPRLPSVEDYAKILVLAAARVGHERSVGLFTESLEGRPIRVRLCALLKGVRTDGRLMPVDGICLETLPKNGDEFPRSLYVQIDEHDIRHEQYAQRAMLSIEHDLGPALYSPDAEIDRQFPVLSPRPTIRNPQLSSLSLDTLCRAMSIEINHYVDWFRQWWDYGDVDAFFLNAGYSCSRRDTKSPSIGVVCEEQLGTCLEIHRLLERFKKLDLCIARWLRSKRATLKEDRLMELRIALESVLLSDDRGVVGEKRHRLAMRGAWLLGRTFEERKMCFRGLRDAYDFASNVIHAGNLKKKNAKKVARTIDEAQDLCREAILRIVNVGAMPNWSDIVLGKRFPRGS